MAATLKVAVPPALMVCGQLDILNRDVDAADIGQGDIGTDLLVYVGGESEIGVGVTMIAGPVMPPRRVMV